VTHIHFGFVELFILPYTDFSHFFFRRDGFDLAITVKQNVNDENDSPDNGLPGNGQWN